MNTLQTQSKIIQKKPYLSLYLQERVKTNIFSLSTNKTNLQIQKSINQPHLKNDVSNIPTIYIQIEDQKRPLSSLYNPIKEAELMLEKANVKWEASQLCVILGLGNLHILPLVQNLLKTNQICIVVCAFFELGQLLTQECELLWDFLERPGSHIFFGLDMQASLQNYLETLPIEGLSGLNIIKQASMLRLAPEFFEECEKLLQKIIKARLSDLLTRMEFEKLWVKNIIENTNYLPRKTSTPTPHGEKKIQTIGSNIRELKTILDCKDLLSNIPGVLVAAGPSLSESKEELLLLKERAFILCVDTALKVLLRMGIRPDAVITLDAQPHTIFAFQGVDLQGILLFADLACNPAVIRNTQIDKLIFSTTAQISQIFDGSSKQQFTTGTEYAQSIYGEIGYLQSGGSVATSGFDLLRILGCEPIFFLGLDQAYTDRKIHSMGTHHTDRFFCQTHRTKSFQDMIEAIIQKRNCFEIDAIETLEYHSSEQEKNSLEKLTIQTEKNQTFQNPTATHTNFSFKDLDIKKDKLMSKQSQKENQNEFKKTNSNSKKIIGDYILNLYKTWFEDALSLTKRNVYQITKRGAYMKHAKYLETPKKFIENMPKLKPQNNPIYFLYKKSSEKYNYAHKETSELCEALQDILANPSTQILEKYFSKNPFLKFASKQAEIYVKRNKAKLDSHRALEVSLQKTLDMIKKLERSIRKYVKNKI